MPRRRRAATWPQQLRPSRPRRPADRPDRQVRRRNRKGASRSVPISRTGFRKDQLAGQKSIVGQWANLHNGSAQNWVKNDMSDGKYQLCGQYIQEWQKAHKAEVKAEIDRIEAFKKANPDKPAPDQRTSGSRTGSPPFPTRQPSPSRKTSRYRSSSGFPASIPACSPAPKNRPTVRR